MNGKDLRGAIALGSLTATVALLAGLGTAQAQIGSGQPAAAPVAPTGAGAGSFPQSFLIPGTNTSLSLYGKIAMAIDDNLGSMHTTDPSTSGGSTASSISQLVLEGPGAAGGASNLPRAFHAGLRFHDKSTNFTVETRTPSDLGEIKTVMMIDFSLNANQSNYIGTGTAITSTKPNPAAGNSEIPRLLWAYGTLGPWLLGQYNSAWADPLMTNPDIGDQSQVGPLQTANIRRPQVRYTYLAGNGITLSGSVEAMDTGAQACLPTSAASTTCSSAVGVPGATLGSSLSDNTIGGSSGGGGGIYNLPSFNTGIAWDQPWGHVMGRVGVGRSEYRNIAPIALNATNGGFSNNVTRWNYAIEGGVMINTFGQDQWRGLINYSHGLYTYMTDLSGGYDMDINGQTGQVSSVTELALNTSYIHRFNPNWRTSAEFGVGFFNKPASTSGWTNCATASANAGVCVSGGSAAAQLASVEKRHIQATWSLTYSPVPGMVDLSFETDYYDRQVQAAGTGTYGMIQRLGASFYW